MSCTNYFDCDNNELHWEDILKMLVVECEDGLYLKTNECTTGSSNVCGDNGTFTNADLVGNRLAINHSCDTTNVATVTIYDPSNVASYMVFTLGDLLGANTSDYVTVDFGGALGAGTYKWVLTAVT